MYGKADDDVVAMHVSMIMPSRYAYMGENLMNYV